MIQCTQRHFVTFIIFVRVWCLSLACVVYFEQEAGVRDGSGCNVLPPMEAKWGWQPPWTPARSRCALFFTRTTPLFLVQPPTSYSETWYSSILELPSPLPVSRPQRLQHVGTMLAHRKPWPAFLDVGARAMEEWEDCPSPVQEALA